MSHIETHLDGRVTLHRGDCLDVLARLPANGIDSVVTDPPYHLTSIVQRFGADDAAPAAPGVYGRSSRGFMGKQWDGGEVAFDPATWAAMLRVLKPGGHLLAFGAPKNFGFMQYAIAQAGFEVRDVLCWMFGSGFPKSHDVSKGIDRRKDWTALPRFHAAVLAARKRVGISQSEAARRCGLIGPNEDLGGGGFMWFESGLRVPTRDLYLRIKAALELDDNCDAAFEAAEREVIGQHADGTSPGGFGEHRFSFNSQDITAPATDAAREWQGWGTALKPAYEPIIMARKPLIGTVAANVLQHGTGAINIDGCRVGTDEITTHKTAFLSHGGENHRPWHDGHQPTKEMHTGRWPANVLHDGSDEVVGAFPAETSSGHIPRSGNSKALFGGAAQPITDRANNGHGDSGSAARFFYTAKADQDDRLGSKHPTVKPLDLMQWLVRLVTPKGGLVLDPFAGTGTTGEAAWREGMDAVLIEREPEYCADIARRMALALSGPDERLHQTMKEKLRGKRPDHGPLFSEIWEAPFYKDEVNDA